jgi:hypothetical protein
MLLFVQVYLANRLNAAYIYVVGRGGGFWCE